MDLTPDKRVNQAVRELMDIQSYQGGDAVDQNDFRKALHTFLGRHGDQALNDLIQDDVLGGSKGAADNEYAGAVSQLGKLYEEMTGTSLSRQQQQALLGQAEQVVYADVDSYVEQQTGEDPGNFKPTAQNSNPVETEAENKIKAETDPNIAAPRTGLSKEQAQNLAYTQGPTAGNVTAGNEMGLGHQGGATKDVQQFLVDKGFFGDAADGAFDQADGMYGPKTEAAVTQWQKTQGLEATGKVDAETLQRMGLGGESTAATKETDKTTTTGNDRSPEALRTAMSIRNDISGPGSSDYKGMAANILNMSPSEVAELKQVYPTIADGESLEAALRSDVAVNADWDTNNDVDALLAVINGDRSGAASETGSIRDADKLKTAMLGNSGWNPFSGAGTDEASVTSILANRSPEQMKGIAAEFKAQTGENLRDRIKKETSVLTGDEVQLQGIYLALLDHAGVK